jgi:hypothetical protein
MIEASLDEANAILHLQPRSSLEKADFQDIVRKVDPFIAAHGRLAGLIIETPAFPGWDSAGAMVAHLRFVKDHHRHIRKVALVTDSSLGSVAADIAAHFVAAEIKSFPASGFQDARQWILE